MEQKHEHNKKLSTSTIKVSTSTRDQLALLKYKNGFSTYEEIILQLLGAST